MPILRAETTRNRDVQKKRVGREERHVGWKENRPKRDESEKENANPNPIIKNRVNKFLVKLDGQTG